MQTSLAVIQFITILRQRCKVVGGNHATDLRHSRVIYVSVSSYDNHTNTLRVLQQCLAMVLDPYKIAHELQGKLTCPNLVFVIAAALPPRLVVQLLKTAPEICLRREVYSCRTIDVKRALLISF